MIALGLLNVLFAAFLAVQVRVLFGGDDHVLDTAGLTYAQYAREGFYQLLVVAFLVLAVVEVAGRRRGERTGRRPTPVELLLGVLCLLTLVVLASALRRLGLLEDTYGFTLTRLFGHAGTLWVGAVLLGVMAAGAARRTDLLPRALVAATAAGLVAFSLANPEGLVARENVDRFERTGKIDTRYLRTLGADATPALERLPRAERGEADPERPEDEGLFAYNLARARARSERGVAPAGVVEAQQVAARVLGTAVVVGAHLGDLAVAELEPLGAAVQARLPGLRVLPGHRPLDHGPLAVLDRALDEPLRVDVLHRPVGVAADRARRPRGDRAACSSAWRRR